ncbi:MAG: HNH endonuclease [Gemmataceae bacterium]|nr:HNH endonuclease [Gemmataceae bacterium]
MDAQTKRFVRQRADKVCEYCRLWQEHEPFFSFQVEHVIPKKHGGSDDPRNLALACYFCNTHKGSNLTGIDPKTNRIVR